jgi:hypothetical protein
LTSTSIMVSCSLVDFSCRALCRCVRATLNTNTRSSSRTLFVRVHEKPIRLEHARGTVFLLLSHVAIMINIVNIVLSQHLREINSFNRAALGLGLHRGTLSTI